MREIKDNCYKGTRILLGNAKRDIINGMIQKLVGMEEISIPIIQPQAVFSGKVGEENNNLMFNFKDRGDRDLCLAPEYTAVIQQLAQTAFKLNRDKEVFYVQECFRGEKPQAGRYRQFTQFGVEVINPSLIKLEEIIELAQVLLSGYNLEWSTDVTRGLDYYKGGKGFEARFKDGMQVLGGGEYEGGIGFAIGIDRLI